MVRILYFNISLNQSRLLYIHSAILTILHDTVKNPQNSTVHFKELVMKCIWKITKDFERWGDDLCYELVFERVHKFLEVNYTIHYVIKKRVIFHHISTIELFRLLKLGN